MIQVRNIILSKYQPSLPSSAASPEHLLLPLLVRTIPIIRPPQLMCPKTRIETPFPKLPSELREEQEMPQEDKGLWDSPAILRIDLPALLAEEQQIVPNEMVPSDHLPQVELVLHHAAQSEEVEGLMRVVIVPADAKQRGTDVDGIAIGQIVTRRRTNLLILRSKLAATRHVRHRAEVDQPASVVPVHHNIHLLDVTMHQFLLREEEQRHADVLHHLHLAGLGETAFAQIVGIVLEKYLAVGKRLLALSVAEIFGDVGTDPIANVLQEVTLVLQGDIAISFSCLQAYFADQTAISPDSISALCDHAQLGHSAVDARLRNITIDPMNDLRIPAGPDGLLPPALFDLDGSEYQLGALLFPLGNVLQQCLQLKSEYALG